MDLFFSEQKLLDFAFIGLSSIEWQEDVQFEIYAKVIAVILQKIKESKSSLAAASSAFEELKFHQVLENIRFKDSDERDNTFETL